MNYSKISFLKLNKELIYEINKITEVPNILVNLIELNNYNNSFNLIKLLVLINEF